MVFKSGGDVQPQDTQLLRNPEAGMEASLSYPAPHTWAPPVREPPCRFWSSAGMVFNELNISEKEDEKSAIAGNPPSLASSQLRLSSTAQGILEKLGHSPGKASWAWYLL